MIFSSEYRLPFIFGPPFGQNTGKSLNLHGPVYGGQIRTTLKNCFGQFCFRIARLSLSLL
jgi:hypothetical protein